MNWRNSAVGTDLEHNVCEVGIPGCTGVYLLVFYDYLSAHPPTQFQWEIGTSGRTVIQKGTAPTAKEGRNLAEGALLNFAFKLLEAFQE